MVYKYLPYGVTREDQPERHYYDLTVPSLTQQQKLILGWPEEWQEIRDFDHWITGEKDRREKAAAEAEPKK